jgi:hypothetical protein
VTDSLNGISHYAQHAQAAINAGDLAGARGNIEQMWAEVVELKVALGRQ